MDENNTSSLMKLTLYDRIFKPQTVTLSNGHSVQRRRSRAPLIVLFLVVIIWLSLKMTGFDLHVVITKFRKMVDLLEKIFQPDWTFFPKVISPLIDTIKMSILGTADVSMGRGAIVIGLAAIIIGEVLCDAIFRKGCNFAVRLLFVVFGGVVYYAVMVLILWLKLDPNDLTLFTALIVAIFLAVPYLREQRRSSFARSAKGGSRHA